MFIRHRRRWEIAEREATPEALFVARRSLLKAGAAALAAETLVAAAAFRGRSAADPTADLYPAKRNPAFKLDRPLTPEVGQSRITTISTNSA